MNVKMRNIIRKTCFLSVVLTLLLMWAVPVNAAKLSKKAKSKFVLKNCYYTQAGVTLTWKKVKGATKYLVYCAAKKKGKYTAIQVVKGLTVTVPASGECYYKVLATRGRTKSKFSDPVHLFPAGGQIEKSEVSKKNDKTLFDYTDNETLYYVNVKNQTQKPMQFRQGGVYRFLARNSVTKKEQALSDGALTEDVTIAPLTEGTLVIKANRMQVTPSDCFLVIRASFNIGSRQFMIDLTRDPTMTTVPAVTK